MLILILIDAQYSQKAVFSFEKESICQKSPHHRFPLPGKKNPPSTISGSPTPYCYLENPEGSTLRTALDFKKLKIIYILLRYYFVMIRSILSLTNQK